MGIRVEVVVFKSALVRLKDLEVKENGGYQLGTCRVRNVV